MKILILFLICSQLISCTCLKNKAQDYILEGVIKNNEIGLKDVSITVEAIYSRYPSPDFPLYCNEYKLIVEKDIKVLSKDYFKNFKDKVYETKSDSIGHYKIQIPFKIIKNTWFYNEGYPKYNYIRIIFNKEGFEPKILPFVPTCDSIINELKCVKMR